MKKTFLTLVIASCSAVASFAQAVYCDKVIGGYIPWWYNLDQYTGINYGQLTHAYFAFIGSKTEGGLCAYKRGPNGIDLIEFEGNTEVTAAFDLFKQKATEAKTKKIISIGGAGSDIYLFGMAQNATYRANFVKNIWDFVSRNQLDGIDLDWEALENTNHTNAYKDLLTDLQTAKPAGKLVVATVMPSDNYGKWFPAETVNNCDLVQLMAYDNTATWPTSPKGNHSTLKHATDAILYWKEKGTPESKLVLGLPFYGYQQKNNVDNGNGLNTAVWTYKAIIAAYNPGPEIDNYGVPDKDETIGFNGINTIKAKAELGYAIRGVMAWESTQDVPYSDSKSLHKAIIETFKAKCSDGHGGVKDLQPAVATSYYNAQLNQLRVTTAKYGKVKVTVYNILGEEIAAKDLGTLGIGEYGVSLDKATLKAGIYLVTVAIAEERASSKVYIE